MNYIGGILMALIATTSFAQNLPRKSSGAEVEQMVGLTEVEIAYSRPNVNGRVIFGDLVPFGEVWRLGANAPTTMHINQPIEINGQQLDTGSYAIFAIPEKNYWTVVFNTDTKQWGSGDYDAKKNVLSYTAAVSASDFTESFQISFESVNETSAVLCFEWDAIKVMVPFTTKTDEAVSQGIQAAIKKGEDLPRVYFRAADYFNDAGNTETAEGYLEESLALERTYYNVFLEAQMRYDSDPKAAMKLGEEAVALAKKAEKQGWADYIGRTLNEWKGE